MKIDLKPGTYRLIRVDGAEEVVAEKPTVKKIQEAIGCACFDSVTLTRQGGRPEIIMLVDDTGMVDGKPVNPKATELYHGVCKPGTPYSIHGDAAIVHDEDFA